MSQSDSKRASASGLSAEAESFVPSHLKTSPPVQTSPGEPCGNRSEDTSPSPTDLPHYITNCYPFVSTENPNSAIRNPAVWQQKTLPVHVSSQSSHPHTQLPPPGMFTYTGSRPPGVPRQPLHLGGNNIRHLRPQRQPLFPQQRPLPAQPLSSNPHQQPGLLPTPPIRPLLPRAPVLSPGGMLPYPRMPIQGGNAMLQQQQVAGLFNQAGLLNQVLFPGGQGTNALNMTLGNMLGTALLGAQTGTGSASGGKQGGNKGKNKKKSKDRQNLVSTGTQNEGGKPHHESKKRSSRPKTLICRDATSQTDFCDDIANKTLVEKPSSLFQEERTRNWPELYQDSCTDEEEVDSDSGYCSPKRNQASETHPPTTVRNHPPQHGSLPLPPGYTLPGIIPYSEVLKQPHNKLAPAQAHPAAPGIMQQHHYQQTIGGYALQMDGTHVERASSLADLIIACATGPTGLRPTDNSPLLSGIAKSAPSSIQSSTTKRSRNRKKKSDKHNNKGDVVTGEDVATSASNLLSLHSNNSSSSNTLLLTSSSVSLATTASGNLGSYAATGCDSGQEESVLVRAGNNSSNNQSGIDASNRTEGEEDGATSSGSKRKRKRNRKRKKKSSVGADLGGNQSDGGTSEVQSTITSSSSKTGDRNSTSHAAAVACDILHFEDENEFPDLLSAAGGLSDTQSHATQSLSYSDILKGHHSHALSQESAHSFSSGGFKSSPDTSSVKSSREEKNARRRRKRQEMVDRAASEELAEISLEQQVLRELSVKSQVDPSKKKATKKTKQPISLSIADMISALEEQQKKKEQEAIIQSVKNTNSTNAVTKKAVANLLDASAPKKRGKEREVPKVKKPSPMKKIILKEREEKKRLRLLDEGVDMTANPGSLEPNNNEQEVNFEDEEDEAECETEEEIVEEEQSQGASSNRSSLEIGTGTSASADLSPISQTSPVSMSPPSGSPSSSGLNSPVAGNGMVGPRMSSTIATRIHSRRFREYCTQVLDKDIDNCCTMLLQELVRFQDRMYHKDPTKAKSKRRIVLGIRECAKHLKLKKLKCVIISPNLERIQSKGGLDDALNNIIEDCDIQSVPFVFALGRRALGRACAKLVPVSVVGVFSYEGCEENFHKMVELTTKARDAYTDMIDIMENEILDQNPSTMPPPFVSAANGVSTTHSAPGTSTIGDVQKFFPHLGHSRTPSACSAISFCSSILSEPISENYPHSEPETDSRGYEIVKDSGKGENDSGTEALREKLDRIEKDDVAEGKEFAENHGKGQLQMVETLNDIDEGHEADTEDNPHGQVMKKSPLTMAWGENHETGGSKLGSRMDSSDMEEDRNSVVENGGITNRNKEVERRRNDSGNREDVSCKYSNSIKDSGQGVESSEEGDSSKEFDNDTIEDLPHMESAVYSNFNAISDYSSDILSQQSSRTLDLSAEGNSTHSSKTIEVEINRNSGSESRLGTCSTSVEAVAQKVKTIDKERIESWVIDAQKQIDLINVRDEEEEEKVYTTTSNEIVEVNGITEEDLEENGDFCDRNNKLVKEDLVNDCRLNEHQFKDSNSDLLVQGSKTMNKPGRVTKVTGDDVTVAKNEITNNQCHNENSVNQLDSSTKRMLSTLKS